MKHLKFTDGYEINISDINTIEHFWFDFNTLFLIDWLLNLCVDFNNYTKCLKYYLKRKL